MCAHRHATDHVDEGQLLTLLAGWLPHQRWFAGKGSALGTVALSQRGEVPGMPDGVTVEHLLLSVGDGVDAHIYQLFLGWRPDLPERLKHAVIGVQGGLTAYDALYDHDLSALLLGAIAAGRSLGPLSARSEPGAEIDTEASGLVLGVEQSNTSVVYADSAILKVYRRVQPGPNPDVELHRALHAAGSTNIADPLGELTGTMAGEPTSLALLTRYFANSADGWAMATTSVRDLMAEGDLHADEVGGDFAAEAKRLGAAVAQVHTDLAAVLGTDTLDAAGTAALLEQLAERAAAVGRRVPELAGFVDRIHRVYTAAAAATPTLSIQRIHGDLHLGQVLRTLQGWAVIDFEGEPATPLAVRRASHSPLQDVAGMFRSFDYAAHQAMLLGHSDSQHAYRATEWARRNRDAFCAGYAEVTGSDPREAGPMLRVFELSKAVYEVGYEHGNRPSWLPIPLGAIATLVEGSTP